MELQRQALLVTWALLLTLYVVAETKASSRRGSTKNDINITKWMSHNQDKWFYRLNTTPYTNSSLIGRFAPCLSMELVHDTLMVYFLNKSSQGALAFFDVTVGSSKPGRPKNRLIFNSTDTEDPGLVNRTVEYKLLSADYTNNCSIFKKTTHNKEGCYYWALYGGNNRTFPEWCAPTGMRKGCVVEQHVTYEPSECEVDINSTDWDQFTPRPLER